MTIIAQIIEAYQDLPPLIITSLMVSSAIIFGVFFYWFLKQPLKKFTGFFHSNKYLSLLIKYWHKPLVIVFILLFLYISQPFIVFSEKASEYYSHTIFLFTILLVTLLIIQVVYSIRDIVVDKSQRLVCNIKTRKMHTKVDILVKIAVIVIVIIGCAIALLTFPKIRQIGISILASAGIAGVILGFAAQKSLGNILAGIQIAFTQPFRIGDVVIVEDNEWGTIEEITLTYVVVCIWDKRRLIVPITYFIENMFQNWTRHSSDIIGTVSLEVDYTTPIQEIRNELNHILSKSKLWDGRVKNLVVNAAKEKTIELKVFLSAKDAAMASDLRCHVREKLIEYLQKNHPSCLPTIRITNTVV